MAATYVDALWNGVDYWRWNYDSPLGTPASVTYGFMTGIPSYYYEDGVTEMTNFLAFNAAQKTAAQAVLATYAEIAHLTFTQVANGQAGEILFGMNAQGGSAGYAYYGSTFGGVSGDVWIADTPSFIKQSNLDVTPGTYGYLTLVHELGHVMGLKHTFQSEDGGNLATLDAAHDSDRYSVMSYTHQPNELFMRVLNPGTPSEDLDYYSVQPAGPQLYDIAALQYIYGANSATRAGNTAYTFDPHTPFFKCIWDGGGSDTISVANFSLGCRIDLRAGQFSDITILPDAIPAGWTAAAPTYDGRNNLSIAFGAAIENATGGAGNDTLGGTSAANVLKGNAGADRLNGLDGADQLYGGNGADVLTGGPGADRFVFNTPLGGPGDTIADFKRAQGDKLVLDDAQFAAVGASLTASEFRAATDISAAGGATTSAQRILYDADSGHLYYDADGLAGDASPVLFATLATKPALAVAAFQVI